MAWRPTGRNIPRKRPTAPSPAHRCDGLKPHPALPFRFWMVFWISNKGLKLIEVRSGNSAEASRVLGPSLNHAAGSPISAAAPIGRPNHSHPQGSSGPFQQPPFCPTPGLVRRPDRQLRCPCGPGRCRPPGSARVPHPSPFRWIPQFHYPSRAAGAGGPPTPPPTRAEPGLFGEVEPLARSNDAWGPRPASPSSKKAAKILKSPRVPPRDIFGRQKDPRCPPPPAPHQPRSKCSVDLRRM